MTDLSVGSSEYEQERQKWEQPNRKFVEFPKMLYKAVARDGGKPEVEQLTVPSLTEESRAEHEGWSHGPDEALAAFEGLAQDIATAAAEAAGQVRSMSAKAQREYTDAERTSEDHVTDVTPEKRSHHKKRE